MSRPRKGALIDALRLIVLGGDVSTLPKRTIADLRRRRWVRQREIALTAMGSRELKADGERALDDVFRWLKSEEAKPFFQS